MVRIAFICSGDETTTVLAHYRAAGISGAGMRSPDLLGAWCCAACHDCVDGRGPKMGKAQRDLYLLQGVMRTQAELIKRGVVTW